MISSGCLCVLIRDSLVEALSVPGKPGSPRGSKGTPERRLAKSRATQRQAAGLWEYSPQISRNFIQCCHGSHLVLMDTCRFLSSGKLGHPHPHAGGRGFLAHPGETVGVAVMPQCGPSWKQELALMAADTVQLASLRAVYGSPHVGI